MNIKIKNQNGEWVEAAYTLDGDNLLVEPKDDMLIPQNGDILAQKGGKFPRIMICKTYIESGIIDAHVFFDTADNKIRTKYISRVFFDHFATEEEKKILFGKMEEEGYEWDAEKKEVRKKQWKPKARETYYSPSYSGCYSLFHPEEETWENHYLDVYMLNVGWCFKTEEDCQAMCDKINEEIKKLRSCESNNTK